MQVISFCFHDVVRDGRVEDSGFADPTAASYKLELEDFADHMRALADLKDGALMKGLSALELPSDKTSVLMTFDDGGVSAYTCIADVLEQYGWRGHFFVTTDYVERTGFLCKSQIVELARRGHIIGSHSCSHRGRMSHFSRERLHQEWGDSADYLAQLIGQPILTGSVPSGCYAKRVAEVASEVGIKVVFTLEPTARPEYVGDCLVLGRYLVRRTTKTRFVLALATQSLAARMQQITLWTLKGYLKRSKHYTAIRSLYLTGRHRS